MAPENVKSGGQVGTQVQELVDRFHGGSIRAAAADLDMPVTTLFQIVRHKRQPRLDLVRRLAAFYQVSLDWLLTGSGSGPDYAADVRDALANLPDGFERYSPKDDVPAPAGSLAWAYLLVHRIGLQGDSLGAWKMMPLAPLVFALDTLLFTQFSSGQSKSTSALNDVPLGFREAMDASCRVWHAFISVLLRVRGADALRSLMERSHADTVLGFSPTAAGLARGTITPADFISHFGVPQVGLSDSGGRSRDGDAARRSPSPSGATDSARRNARRSGKSKPRASRRRR